MSEVKLFNVGPDEISEQDCKGFVWVVAWYETGYYDGSGNAISFDGEVYREHNLGHCSCFGPESGMQDGDVISIDLVIGESVNAGSEYKPEVISKVRELVAAMRTESSEGK